MFRAETITFSLTLWKPSATKYSQGTENQSILTCTDNNTSYMPSYIALWTHSARHPCRLTQSDTAVSLLVRRLWFPSYLHLWWGAGGRNLNRTPRQIDQLHVMLVEFCCMHRLTVKTDLLIIQMFTTRKVWFEVQNNHCEILLLECVCQAELPLHRLSDHYTG